MRAITRLASITGSTNVLGLYFHHSIDYGDILEQNGNFTFMAQGDSWDHDVTHKCVCDSSWPVGLDAGQRQLSEWFGPDCSLRRCPSGDDPYTSIDEVAFFNTYKHITYLKIPNTPFTDNYTNQHTPIVTKIIHLHLSEHS